VQADAHTLIYDWNEQDRRGPLRRKPVALLDETLRDGLQSPSVRDPTIEQKMELLRLMARLGIDAVDLGLPGAGPRARRDVGELLRFLIAERLPIRPNCAARTLAADITPIVELSQEVGVAIEVTTFIGSSPVRARAEGWQVADLVRRTREAVAMIVAAGLPASFVTEDTTRSHPATLDTLFRAAIDAGATRLVLCDTCGHATPDGVRSLIGFTRGLLRALDVEDRVALDWHGHNDRGHALTTALFALECGVDRVHGSGSASASGSATPRWTSCSSTCSCSACSIRRATTCRAWSITCTGSASTPACRSIRRTRCPAATRSAPPPGFTPPR
jgi:2-isopropylmalate synthase